MGSTQVAVRLSDESLERLDWLVARCSYENRAEAIRAALDEHARREHSRQTGEQIVEGYRRLPQRSGEVAAPDFSSWRVLDDEDWSDWT